jgi:tetratricopeptide (TPR) repeat protein
MKKLTAIAFLMIVTLTTYSQSAKEFLKKGGQQYKAKDYENALKTYKEGLKLHPDDAKLNLQTGLTYLSMPNKKESLTYLQTAFTLNPTVDPDIYYYLGLSYQSNRQYKSAEEFFAEYKRRNKKAAALADAKIRQSQFADSLTRIPSDVVVENIGKAINSSFHEYSPLVSADGNTMIFTSRKKSMGYGLSPQRSAPT